QRDVQKNYVANMIAAYNSDKANEPLKLQMAKLSESKISNTDIRSLALTHLIQLHGKINRVILRLTDKIVRAEQQYIEKQIKEAVSKLEGSSLPYRPILNQRPEHSNIRF